MSDVLEDPQASVLAVLLFLKASLEKEKQITWLQRQACGWQAKNGTEIHSEMTDYGR